MAFGQPAGPPATDRQLAQLLRMVQASGHRDFRDARGPLGFSQRQAAGRFTRDEADGFIQQLEQSPEPCRGTGGDPDEPVLPGGLPRRGVDKLLEGVATDSLAAELQRRGWIVIEP